jgi:serine acetyltransferase
MKETVNQDHILLQIHGRPITLGHRTSIWSSVSLFALDLIELGDGLVIGANSVVARRLPVKALAVHFLHALTMNSWLYDEE